MEIINIQQEIIKQQEEIIQLQENETKAQCEKINQAIEDFNNLPNGEVLYNQQLNEKIDQHKYRVKKYNQFIFKHGMIPFTKLLIDAHQSVENDTPYLQNFHEFINFCDKDVQEKIRIEYARREFEMMTSIYMDFMPLLNPEKVVNHMVYLDDDFGEALNKLDKLLD